MGLENGIYIGLLVLACVSALASPSCFASNKAVPTPPRFEITSPHEKGTYKIGDTVPIAWQVEGTDWRSNDWGVRVELFAGSEGSKRLYSTGTLNSSGSFRWTITEEKGYPGVGRDPDGWLIEVCVTSNHFFNDELYALKVSGHAAPEEGFHCEMSSVTLRILPIVTAPMEKGDIEMYRRVAHRVFDKIAGL